MLNDYFVFSFKLLGKNSNIKILSLFSIDLRAKKYMHFLEY